jgi:hypothetical protein
MEVSATLLHGGLDSTRQVTSKLSMPIRTGSCSLSQCGSHWKQTLLFSLLFFLSMGSALMFFVYFFGLECVGHSFAYVAHFVFLRDVCIRTHRASVSSRRATNLATHLPNLPPFSLLSYPYPYLATHLPT